MIKTTVRALTVVTLAFGLNAAAKPTAAPTTATKVKTAPAPAKSTVATTPVQESYFANFEYEMQTSLSRGGIESLKKGGETTTVIGAQASITKVIKNNIQAGAELQFFNESGGGGSSYFEVMGVGIYNLDNNLKESLYGKVGLGMLNVVNDKFKNEAKFAFMIGGGKRIPVMEKIAYTPEVRIIVVDGATRFQILALNFSLFY
jgi:hypothetical protein